ncbi:ferric enterobactin transporter-binding protein [Neisseria meningitidis]|nr:ferric enterobactin transporter-binding protein [Neisseria meningitidis]RNK23293.1 ferric enterobactin transporter-binding protein [Neisseria meningitidis]RNK34618.1 ferric enterobactin transporter-binding protein [Neisseria meningitidis]RNL15019.1 ferric enterobactin transporter-binding protein [Neisseria meningitidis]RQJ63874.1 ferric enterobactin transporter-binding protein [Neisseria meningitidis]
MKRKRSSERVFQTTFSVSGILRFAAWFLQVVCLIINILIRMQRNRTP